MHRTLKYGWDSHIWLWRVSDVFTSIVCNAMMVPVNRRCLTSMSNIGSNRCEFFSSKTPMHFHDAQ
ncbi:hypothetical protein T440DRAFT_176772 [Plenodomus tracheiphilus IPT5]|uniref:Uncharacterized protein n=1 Tax=Plenodomus tracheiphilus IPT5 TaxID=1408161 RepID=A0A6A7AYE6_9PLEO|nr:hypothetical protein T440DRAFT_176772 [Plenodomus tracheiphilus IPT5]